MSIWSGRFRGGLHPKALAYSSSLSVDRRLYREDIEGSLAHLAMLAKQNIVSRKEAAVLQRGLRGIAVELGPRGKKHRRSPNQEGKSGGPRFVAEDIHMDIEHRLIRKTGPPGGKLHTARSRNDQVALDERLYLRNAIHSIATLLRTFQKTLLRKAHTHRSVLMPGYTHLQRAQPVLLAHHLLAYVSMLERDRQRFSDALRRANRSPLGAGALAGTSFPVDRSAVARKLGFDGIVENSIDAVSDRDALIEFISACAITMMHLSRLAEELVLWSSQEWRFVEIEDAFATGSSIMPQKKNPDIAELIRGKTGRVYGDLIALLTVMKGLPLAYNRDMQEDKRPLFDAADTVAESLEVFSLMVAGLSFARNRFEEELRSDFLMATELADFLARKGMPFRKAHAIVGAVVRRCAEKRCSLRELPLSEYRRYSKLFGSDLPALLDPRKSLSRKKSAGSTSPGEVEKQLRTWEKRLRSPASSNS